MFYRYISMGFREKIVYKTNRVLFSGYIASSKHLGVGSEVSKAVQKS